MALDDIHLASAYKIFDPLRLWPQLRSYGRMDIQQRMDEEGCGAVILQGQMHRMYGKPIHGLEFKETHNE